MLKKSITYKNYLEEEVTEDFYFNLNKAELVELEMSHEDGLSEALKRIIASKDGGEIIREFKNIIMKSYGVKSEDGRRFIKNQQVRDEFESTEAYSVLFIELVTNADAAAEFVNGVIPGDLNQLKLVPQPENEKRDGDETPYQHPAYIQKTEPPAQTDGPEDPKYTHAHQLAEDALRQDSERSLLALSEEAEEARKLSPADVAAMDADELKAGLASGRYVT